MTLLIRIASYTHYLSHLLKSSISSPLPLTQFSFLSFPWLQTQELCIHKFNNNNTTPTTTQHQQQQHRRQHFATVRKSFRALFFSSRYLKSGKGCEKRPATEAAWGDCKIFIPSYKTLNLSGLNWGWSRNCFLLQRFLFLSLWIRYNIVFCWQCYSQHNWSFYRHTSRRYLHRAGGCILL